MDCDQLVDSCDVFCEPGLGGAGCLEDIDECQSFPCRNGGICQSGCGLDTYVCECPVGYDGEDCDVERDECLSVPCMNGGVCTDGLNSYSCICPDDWSGYNCMVDVDSCASSPCVTGTCTDSVVSYTCECEAGTVGRNCEYTPETYPGCDESNGFTGINCDENIDECAPGPCLHAGICTDGIGGYKCDCPSSHGGASCEVLINYCASGPCMNGGACSSLVDDFLCDCAAGFVGDVCEDDVDECASTPCAYGGICTDSITDANVCPDRFSCDCPSGYDTSDRCRPPECPAGTTGPTCEQDISECASRPCAHGSVCTELELSTYTCACTPGWEGENCELDVQECESVPCQHGSTCNDGPASYTCECVPAFQGENCAEDFQECARAPWGDPCDHGECVEAVGSYSCICDPGWADYNCDRDIDECDLNPCQNGAFACLDSTDNRVDTVCVDNVCVDIDIPADGAYRCMCAPGWGDGVCADGWIAEYAEQCAVTAGYVVADSDPVVYGGSCGLDINECASNPCMNGGECTDSSTNPDLVAIDMFLCECSRGFENGDAGRCELEQNECESFPCANGAVCDDVSSADLAPGTYQCTCVVGYLNGMCDLDIEGCSADSDDGGNCDVDINECASLQCENGAACYDSNDDATVPNDAYGCACVLGYAGGMCPDGFVDVLPVYRADCDVVGGNCDIEADACLSNPCENGVCEGFATNSSTGYRCLCPDGYANGWCTEAVPALYNNLCQVDNGNCNLDIDECASQPCFYGGRCVSSIADTDARITVRDVAGTVTQIGAGGEAMAGYTTYQLSLSLTNDRAGVYALYGTADAPMYMPPAWQLAGSFGADIGGIHPAIWLAETT